MDSGSSNSFVSEWLAQHLHLSRSRVVAQVSGVGGVCQQSTTQSVVNVTISSVWGPGQLQVFKVEALVLPKITCDLPLRPVPLDTNWHHLSGIKLADPDFGTPGSIDLLLGADLFDTVVLHGRRRGPHGSPSAFEPAFGWVLSGTVHGSLAGARVVTHNTAVSSGDDLLRKFWEVDALHTSRNVMSVEERSVVDHFNCTHCRDHEGRFVVALPKKPDAPPLGESRSLATKSLLSLERSLRAKGQFEEFQDVVEEYFHLGLGKASGQGLLPPGACCGEGFQLHHEGSCSIRRLGKVLYGCLLERPTDGWSHCSCISD